MAQISSRGASRAFIVAVFQRALDWAIKETAKGEAITFPYPTAVVADWLAKAKDDCDRDPSPYGGTPFDSSDPSTHWTKTEHFFTWYKNNVERKSKQSSLAYYASLVGLSEPRELEKQRYCLSVSRTTFNLTAHHTKNRASGGEPVEFRRMPEPIPAYLSESLEGCIYSAEIAAPVPLNVVTPCLPKATRKRKPSHKGSPLARSAKRSSRDDDDDEEDEEDEDGAERGCNYQPSFSLHAMGMMIYPRCSPDSAQRSASQHDYEVRDLFGEVVDDAECHQGLLLDVETVDFTTTSPSKWQQLVSPFGMSLNSVDWTASNGEDEPALLPPSDTAVAMLDEALNSPLLSNFLRSSPPKMRWLAQKLVGGDIDEGQKCDKPSRSIV